MKRIQTLTFMIAYLLAAVSLFAEVEVLNPVPGTWANRQVLVLAMPDGDDAFYSVNGADPLVSGFAYDGPVQIDVTGNVEIRIVAVTADGIKTEKSVSYTVTEPLQEKKDKTIDAFLDMMSSDAVYCYKPGTVISIPASMQYAVGAGEPIFLQGTDISYSQDSVLVRYIPLMLTDGNSIWRYVIYPAEPVGLCTQRDVPFRISNWTSVTFTDRKYIYSIDGKSWGPGTVPVSLDRSVSHEIRWQSIAYEPGNPVQSFLLPPKPELCKMKLENGEIRLSIAGDASYCIGSTGENIAPGLFQELTFDVFPGDSISGKLDLAFYSDNVYQGNLVADYDIDKRSPAAPVLLPSVKTLLSRMPVTVEIAAEKNAKLFYALSLPQNASEKSVAVLHTTARTGDYKELTGTRLVLDADSEEAEYLEVAVYAQDAAGNKSSISEYGVVIDHCNYYFDAAAGTAGADGSREHPFTSLTDIPELFTVRNRSHFIRLYIRGKQSVPHGTTVLQADCEIKGTENAELVFSAEDSFILRAVSLDIDNCLITRSSAATGPADQGIYLFVAENSVLDFNQCEVAATFGDNGIAISGSMSVISVSDSTVISQAGVYSAAFSLDNCRLKVLKSRISAIASTVVDFSMRNGYIELRSSDCKVAGRIGRAAELLGTNCILTDNTFSGELSGNSSVNPVWKDAAAVTIEDAGNKVNGF